jgi:hypothetical protein
VVRGVNLVDVRITNKMAISRISLPLAALAIVLGATGANALTLTRAAVTGASGTIWTTGQTGNYTLFVATPNAGDYLNPNDQPISLGIAPDAITRALLSGEGYLPGTVVDSDAIYNLTLNFDTGQTLTGMYTPLTNTFNSGGSFTSGGQSYALIEFSFRRDLGDSVQPNVATFGGDGNDYNGNFRLQSGAVPEPAMWLMMLGGFGLVGASMRRRSHAAIAA